MRGHRNSQVYICGIPRFIIESPTPAGGHQHAVSDRPVWRLSHGVRELPAAYDGIAVVLIMATLDQNGRFRHRRTPNVKDKLQRNAECPVADLGLSHLREFLHVRRLCSYTFTSVPITYTHFDRCTIEVGSPWVQADLPPSCETSLGCRVFTSRKARC